MSFKRKNVTVAIFIVVSVCIAGSAHAAQTNENVQLEQLMETLRARLMELLIDAKEKGVPLPESANEYLKPQVAFTKDLDLNATGNDVIALQVFLIKNGVGKKIQKLTAAGATGRFGPITKDALAEFQSSRGITPADGYFGPRTRNYVNKHLVWQI